MLVGGLVGAASAAEADHVALASGRVALAPPAVDAHAVAAPSVALAAQTARRTLPELPADMLTLQLARTARRAAIDGNCVVASVAVSRLGVRDPAYREALVTGPALTGCSFPAVAAVAR